VPASCTSLPEPGGLLWRAASLIRHGCWLAHAPRAHLNSCPAQQGSAARQPIQCQCMPMLACNETTAAVVASVAARADEQGGVDVITGQLSPTLEEGSGSCPAATGRSLGYKLPALAWMPAVMTASCRNRPPMLVRAQVVFRQRPRHHKRQARPPRSSGCWAW